ncbi:MAG: hypothetical protein KDD73_05955, partial [Anaerolineales bacterium]|nr:hypothetical protein [Anaerolineales bacterium]
GWVHQHLGVAAVFEAGALAALIWLLLASGMHQPGRYASRLVSLGDVREGGAGDLVDRLRRVPGVIEAVVVADEGVAYLKGTDRSVGRLAVRRGLCRTRLMARRRRVGNGWIALPWPRWPPW